MSNLRAQAIAENCGLNCVYIADSAGAFLPMQLYIFQFVTNETLGAVLATAAPANCRRGAARIGSSQQLDDAGAQHRLWCHGGQRLPRAQRPVSRRWVVQEQLDVPDADYYAVVSRFEERPRVAVITRSISFSSTARDISSAGLPTVINGSHEIAWSPANFLSCASASSMIRFCCPTGSS